MSALVSLGTIESASAAETLRYGESLGRLLGSSDVVGLVGDLGAGKTLFAQGIARGLQVDPSYRVTSPTFTLINEYPGRVALFHIDLYRLASYEEMQEIGLFDCCGGEGVCVVEWFDRCVDPLRCGYLQVELLATGDATIGEAMRRLEVAAVGRRHLDLGRHWLAECAGSR